MPASFSVFAVPSVPMRSKPRSRRPRANSTRPSLSATLRSARRGETIPITESQWGEPNYGFGGPPDLSRSSVVSLRGELRSREEARVFHDLGHDFLPPDWHDVDAVDAFDFLQGLDRPDRDADALRPRIRRSLHPVHDMFRDDGTEFLDHEPRHLHGLQRDDAREDEHLIVEPFFPDETHPFLECVDVEDALRLDEVVAVGDLPAELAERFLLRSAEWICGRADEDLRRLLDHLPAPQDAGVAKGAEGRDHFLGAQVVHRFGLLLVASGGRVSP